MVLAPVIAGRWASQHGVVAVSAALNGAGILGLLVAPATAGVLWIVLLGLGQGACFSLALTFFALRASDPEHSAALSGMAQAVGYLFAAFGPSLFGVLRDARVGDPAGATVRHRGWDSDLWPRRRPRHPRRPTRPARDALKGNEQGEPRRRGARPL